MDQSSSKQSANVEAPSSRWLIAGAVLLALVIRLAWALTHGFAIEQEGAEYARIAENLLAGKGYVGILNSGVQLNFPPLYPILIAAVSFFVGNAEWAARAINIALGAALVIPVFQLTRLAYGRNVAIAAAALVIFHPVLISGSASTYSEGPYLTVMMFALLCIVQWVLRRTLLMSVVAGVLLGLAYLIRPEAFLLAGLFTACGLVAAYFMAERRQTVIAALSLFGAFILIAAPNIAFLTYETGKLRIEAKGTLAYEWGSRINRGMSYPESANGIGPDLSDQGVFMRPNLDVIQSTSYSAKEYLEFVVSAAKKNLAPIVQTITSDGAFGSPWLFALVVLGIFGTPWSRVRLRVDGLFVTYIAVFILVLLTVQALWFRYFYAILGMLLLWAAKGADELGAWAEGTIGALVNKARVARLAGLGLRWVAVIVVLLVSMRNIGSVSQFEESLNKERKEAGLWLANQGSGHKWIMDVGVQTAYYARGDLMYLPYADSDLAIRYLSKRNPDYIVLIGGSDGGLSYTAEWFAHGIPSANASLVYDEPKPDGEHIKIYRWTPVNPAQ